MKPRQVLGKYFEVYGQAGKITPEAGKKRAPFYDPETHLSVNSGNLHQNVVKSSFCKFVQRLKLKAYRKYQFR